MTMKAYGKGKDEMSEKESRLFLMDMMLTASIVMARQMGGGILALLMGASSGTANEIEKDYIARQLYAGMELLGIPEPTNVEELESLITKVDETVYSATKFTEDFYAGFDEIAAKKEAEKNATEEPQG